MLILLLAPSLFGQDLSEPAVADPLHRVVQVEISATDPILAPYGPCQVIVHTSDFSGTLHVWASSADMDPLLRVEASASGLAAEDDDGGCGSTAYLALTVEPGLQLRMQVASVTAKAVGSVEVHMVSAPETLLTREAASAANTGCGELIRLHESGQTALAREQISGILSALVAVPGADESEECARACSMVFELASRLFKIGIQRQALQFSLHHRERCLPPRHTGIHYFRAYLGVTYLAYQDHERARELMQPAIDELFSCLSESEVELYPLAASLGTVLYEMGDLEPAQDYATRSTRGLVRLLGERDQSALAAQTLLSHVLSARGDTFGALLLAERVYSIRRELLPQDDPLLLIACSNLAACLIDLGDIGRAREVLEECGTSEHMDGPHSAISGQNLAILCLREQRYEDARDLFEEALSSLEDAVPTERLKRTDTLLNLAVAYAGLGDYERAHEILDDAVADYSGELPVQARKLALARGNLALCKVALGQVAEACDLLDLAYREIAETVRSDDQELWRIQSNLVRMHTVSGNLERASTLALELVASVSQAIPDWAIRMSARELESRVVDCSWLVSSALLLALEEDLPASAVELTQAAFSCSEALRGVGLLHSVVDRAFRNDRDVIELRRKVSIASTQLARTARRGASQEELAGARNARDEFQRELALLVDAKTGLVEDFARMNAASLSAACGAGTAVICFRRYAGGSAGAGTLGAGTEERVCAFVVGQNGRLELVDLGPATSIEAAIVAWRGRLMPSTQAASSDGASSDDLARLGEGIRRLVFDPLREVIGDAVELVVIPDDVLWLIPFDCLPFEDGLLGDRYSISVRQTARELLGPHAPIQESGALVTVGGADFDAAPLPPGEPNADPEPGIVEVARPTLAALRSGQPPVLRGTEWETGFPPLPHSASEARDVGELYRAVFPVSEPVVFLEGRRASRMALEEFAPSARFLHVATHGWFAAESRRGAADTRPVGELVGPSPGMSVEEQIRAMSPMLLCGLALAGANLEADDVGQVPGLVTAEEIATWDLSRCELAVLSACDTNVGESRAGQGVASLQKALHMAGARSVITSLWMVPDAGTKELMVDFYRRLWVDKKSKSKALWEAKMALRAKRRPMREWAGWVLSGDTN